MLHSLQELRNAQGDFSLGVALLKACDEIAIPPTAMTNTAHLNRLTHISASPVVWKRGGRVSVQTLICVASSPKVDEQDHPSVIAYIL